MCSQREAAVFEGVQCTLYTVAVSMCLMPQDRAHVTAFCTELPLDL